MEICLTFILLSSTLTLTAADSVRLVNGGSRCAGRVEILHDGQWGTVCDDNWDEVDAAVVCRELRCGEAVNALVSAHFGPGSGPIWMYDLACRGSESTLKKCGSLNRVTSCSHYEDAGVICSGQILRLTAGPHQCSGRVEVFHGGSWSTVCDADFDQKDAEVVCRELGCGIPVEVLGSAAFGRGEGQVWTEELQCRGTESDITFCPTSSSLKHSHCSHDNDVGLICSCHTEARLVNGPDSCSGRVELQYLGEWGTVCAVGWDMRAADVLCAQLDCGSAVAVVEVDWFGEGSGHIWADVFDCQGKETHLSRCGVSSWSRAACSHKHDAGVICNGSSMVFHEGRVRLSGGRECQGEVEIYFRQDWRRVLLDSWSLSEASVLCRQLGCGSVLNYRSSPSTTEHKHMCVTGFSCSGSEDHLGNCSSAQAEPVNCSSGEQLYITCSGIYKPSQSSIRLVGSGGDCAGRLEVFHSGSWGTVCDDSWDIEDAQVVCRQLQCGVALSTHIPAWFGPRTGSIWLNEVECEGNETSLWNCRFQLCEEGECGHHEDVGVVCSEFKEIRLSEGCEGNLEVFYNGTWGNVCHNQMDDETVNMVCRELNCGRRGSLSNTEARVKSAPNWLDELKCRKHDSNLWQCPSSPWGQNRCDNHDEVARITCTEDETSLQIQEKCSSIPPQKHCSKHWSLRLSGGKGSCSGRLEVYHNSTWGSVCDDRWNIRNAQVVCRQLGCGSALSADRNVWLGSGEGTIWMNRVKFRGDEIHLWDCHHSLKNHTDCSHAGVSCADISTMSTATPTTTTTTTT
ncbi:deleted in malignant brain tumors 1 protein-like, partial [Hemibagrus wyckioides]|uniref:deleted in malignant brain tumors 1 protein-like n=1 Tax=Hemibagrus wyckioides TaxID=337641 RepID=UPI00266C44A8